MALFEAVRRDDPHDGHARRDGRHGGEPVGKIDQGVGFFPVCHGERLGQVGAAAALREFGCDAPVWVTALYLRIAFEHLNVRAGPPQKEQFGEKCPEVFCADAARSVEGDQQPSLAADLDARVGAVAFGGAAQGIV